MTAVHICTSQVSVQMVGPGPDRTSCWSLRSRTSERDQCENTNTHTHTITQRHKQRQRHTCTAQVKSEENLESFPILLFQQKQNGTVLSLCSTADRFYRRRTQQNIHDDSTCVGPHLNFSAASPQTLVSSSIL